MYGIRLAGDYFAEVVAPVVTRAAPGLRYGAAILGSGSEVLGFDTPRSADHGFGPRVQLFLHPRDRAGHGPALLAALDRDLPDDFGGMPARFAARSAADEVAHQVVVTDVPAWSVGHFDLDVTARDLTPRDWLGLPWQHLAAATRGAVFRDDHGHLAAMRARLAWYPRRPVALRAGRAFRRIAQEEAFVGRTGEVGDDLGSSVLAARLVRDVMRLALLLRRVWPPYAKWLGTEFARGPDAAALTPALTAALRATGWPEREAALCDAYEYVARECNALGLAAPVEATRRPFHDRPFQVLDAERFTVALLAAVTDPAVAALPPLGGVDLWADSTDVLSHAGRARRATLGLFGR